MAGGGGSFSQSILETPTWALATVCFVFIFLGILIEYLIHLLAHWLKKHGKKALFEAVEKLKSVLMLLGFMSLLLAITQRPISKICVPDNIAFSMLPCRRYNIHELAAAVADSSSNIDDPCAYSSEGEKKMSSFISQQGVNQLNNFIFGLAIMQIAYTLITMAFGRAKMNRWEAWEKESQSVEYLVSNDPNRFRFTKQTTFGRRHATSCTTTPILLWIKCFFRQFFHSVAKVDYLTLRHAFIATHLPTNNSFNFQKYIQRSLEDDFKLVVGIRPFMWFLVVIFLLIDVHGLHAYLFVSFLPLVFVLAIGTKLEVVVAEMAIQLKDQNTVIKGALLLQPNDNLFWFSQPNFVLTLLHYTLFMNAFEITFFIWVTIQYGIKSCYHENLAIVIARVVLAIVVQVMCSYITLPLYALVTQMGTHFKSTLMLEDQTVDVIKQWHTEVKHKRKKRDKNKNKNKDKNTIEQQTGSSSVWTNEDITTESSSSHKYHYRRSPNHHHDHGGDDRLDDVIIHNNNKAVESEIQELDDHDHQIRLNP
ncbi:MLO-like protein 3 [Impatiens glandulifera]|uniref:MLO-like protein 3 n=1 Tax=Impatiens glandulifera TaxID=253017 RepID=UPI001FB15AE4|nr:MLO-like protein 3 [Impatiens glandulifera]